MSKALRMAGTEPTSGGSCLTDPLGNDYPGYIYLLTHYDSTLPVPVFKGIKFINQSDNDTCQEFFLDVASPGDTSLVLWEKKGDNPPVALTPASLKINFIKF